MDEGREIPLPVTQSRSTDAGAHAPHAARANGVRAAALVTIATANCSLPKPSAAAETIAGSVPTRGAEHQQIGRRDNDINLLIRSNKALRRELQGLRVRRWRDEETIEALTAELAQTKRARDSATRQNPLLTETVATRLSWPWSAFVEWLRSRSRTSVTEAYQRAILPGGGPFFERGFRLGNAARIAGATVRRVKSAPSGTLIFGPYIHLAAGTYAATVEARLYQRLPLWADFKLEAVCGDARQLVGLRWFRLCAGVRRRRFELIFSVGGRDDHGNFEIRIWARRGTPLEIAGLDLYQLAAAPPADGAAARQGC